MGKLTSKMVINYGTLRNVLFLLTILIFIAFFNNGANASTTKQAQTTQTATTTLPSFYGYDELTKNYYIEVTLLTEPTNSTLTHGGGTFRIGSHETSYGTIIDQRSPQRADRLYILVPPNTMDVLQNGDPIAFVFNSKTSYFFEPLNKQKMQVVEEILPLRKVIQEILRSTIRLEPTQQALFVTMIPNYQPKNDQFEKLRNDFSDTFESKYWKGNSELNPEFGSIVFERDIALLKFVSENIDFISRIGIVDAIPKLRGSARGLAYKAILDAEQQGKTNSTNLIRARKLLSDADNFRPQKSFEDFKYVDLYQDVWQTAISGR